MIARYRNPWHQSNGAYGPQFYETDARPFGYRGYQVYQRIQGEGVDFVKDGVCVTQRAIRTMGQAGCDAAKAVIDLLIHNDIAAKEVKRN